MRADRTAAPSPGNQGEDKQVEYDIRAPAGGLRREVEAFIGDDERRYFDLTISLGPGHRKTVRVFPDRDMVHRDSTRQDLIHLFAATCFEVVDGEMTGPGLMCSGYVNLQVTHAPLETGKLRILFTEGDQL